MKEYFKKNIIILAGLVATSVCLMGCQKKEIEVDVYSYFEYFFEGPDGEGEMYASLDYDKMCQDIREQIEGEAPSRLELKKNIKKSISYNEDDFYLCENGEEIELEWKIKENDFLKKYNIVIVAEDRDIEVSGLGNYIESVSEIPESFMNRMDSIVIKNFNEQFVELAADDEVVNSVEVVNRLFWYDDDSNGYITVLKVVVSNDYIKNAEYYYYGTFEGILTDDNNTLSVNLDECHIPNGSGYNGKTTGESFIFEGDKGHFYIGFETYDKLYDAKTEGLEIVEEYPPQK